MPHYRAPDGTRYLTDEPPHEGWALMTDAEVVEADAPAPPPVPASISDRQFFQQLAIMGVITEAEALAAVGPGVLPASMNALIEALPAPMQFPVRILLTGAVTFERNHPMTPVLGGAFGWDDAQLDAVWREGAAL